MPTKNSAQILGLERIVSGGQTGVDRAALDVAIVYQIPHGGWCPLGRRAEDGPIDRKYNLTELPSPEYKDRTRQNIIDSDGTLIIYRQRLHGGTLLTKQTAIRNGKPILPIRLPLKNADQKICNWIRDNGIRILNIAGPRASKDATIYDATTRLLTKVFGQTNLFESPSASEIKNSDRA